MKRAADGAIRALHARATTTASSAAISSGYGDRDREDRGFFERAGDEIASWFGDEEAERRRWRDRGDRATDVAAIAARRRDDRFGARQRDRHATRTFRPPR